MRAACNVVIKRPSQTMPALQCALHIPLTSHLCGCAWVNIAVKSTMHTTILIMQAVALGPARTTL